MRTIVYPGDNDVFKMKSDTKPMATQNYYHRNEFTYRLCKCAYPASTQISNLKTDKSKWTGFINSMKTPAGLMHASIQKYACIQDFLD